jgi:CMP-N,N'-diacetyllegionaminic acid synthase
MRNDILIVVPARGGSQRLPGKNLTEIGGRSLIQWTADYLRDEGLLDAALLSTDDKSIADEGRRTGLAVPFIRPAALATHSATTLDVVLHALDHVCADDRPQPAVTAVLQVTSPFRRPGLLRDAVALLAHNPDAGSAVAMTRLHVPSSFVFTFDGAGSATRLTSRAAAALVPTGSLYATRTAKLREQATIYATPIVPVEVSARESIDIDTAEDLAVARALAAATHARAQD